MFIIKKFIVPILTVSLFIGTNSCKEDLIIPKEKEEKKAEKKTVKEEKKAVVFTNPWINNPYKLNVVYFVPKDADTILDYKKRISSIMLNLQDFYAQGLSRANFGNKSFGLNLLSDTDVDIITFRSEMTKKEAAKGFQRAKQELNQYFSENPSKKTSEHTLVIMPSFRENPKDPGGPPFFGSGRFCFALDYPGMSIENLGIGGIDGNLATKWIGGLAHELGHGLNAPHNKEHKTEKSTYGTALMGTGNYTYGKEPTYITNASAALFSSCQVFSTEKRNDWYTDVKHNLIKVIGEYKDGQIIISGQFYSSMPVSVINVYHDQEPSGLNVNDYDALAWNTKPTDKSHFYVKCPLNDFFENQRKGKYELRIDFYHENGTKKGYRFNYEFDDNGIPKIEMINTKDVKSRTNWEVIEIDSENPGNPAKYLLDGNIESVWHTKWKGGEDPLPHYFVVDMKSNETINGFGFANRYNINGAMKEIEIFSSLDNIKWTSLGKFNLKAKGNWQYIDLPNQQTVRYVKVMATSTNGNFKYTHLGEFVAF